MSVLEQIKEFIGKAKKILIITHENPDGDAVGSSLGLMNGLKKLEGKEIDVVIPEMNEMYNFLPGFDEIKKEANPEEYDLCIALDSSDLERLHICKEVFQKTKNTVVIAMYGATAGQVGLLRIATTTNQAVCSVLPDSRYVPEYLYYAIKSKKDWMISQCAGGAQPNISQGVIKRMEIVDAPFEAQKQFATFVEQTDQSKLEIQKSLQQLETLKKALMQKYFGRGGK